MRMPSVLLPLLGGFALSVALFSIQGCASGQSGTGYSRASTQGDLPTASDESESRKRAKIRMELAATYYGQGKYTTALDELKQAINIDPTIPAVHEMRALIYDAMGETSRAEQSYREALALDERNGSVLHNFAWHLCQQKQFAAADSLFARAAALPQSVDTSKTLLARGVCQLAAGQQEEGLRSLSRSYELDPSNPATAFNLASVLYQRKELERARFYIRRLNAVPEQVTAESLWLAIRIEHQLRNGNGQEELASQLRSRFPASREVGYLDLGKFDD